MFLEFLQPELVLFGGPFKPDTKIQHDYVAKDGELVIHQKINRSLLDMAQYPSRQEQELKEKLIAREKGEEFPEQSVQDSQRNVFKAEDRRASMESPTKQGNIQGYYQNEQNPFDEGYYGFNMDAQYAPQQFGSDEAQSPLRAYPGKAAEADHIPFAEQSPDKVQEAEEDDSKYYQSIDAENAFIAGVAEVQFGGGAVDFIDDLGECV